MIVSGGGGGGFYNNGENSGGSGGGGKGGGGRPGFFNFFCPLTLDILLRMTLTVDDGAFIIAIIFAKSVPHELLT